VRSRPKMKREVKHLPYANMYTVQKNAVSFETAFFFYPIIYTFILRLPNELHSP